MERREKWWLAFLILAALAFNVFTLSPVIPWQRWLLWSRPTPDQTVAVEFADSTIHLPPHGVVVAAGRYIEFVATSRDVTYGLGVFRSDGTLVFQMQVVPGYENRIIWKFDRPGVYDVRSTEYSGLRHPEMVIRHAIHVMPEEARQ